MACPRTVEGNADVTLGKIRAGNAKDMRTERRLVTPRVFKSSGHASWTQVSYLLKAAVETRDGPSLHLIELLCFFSRQT